mmetsp:Transcript_18155/g.20771  ORF Transcript_18155/g.20771 Transcript_18155/m.20771 type:complete len:89 (+) Transcript_18155:3-269(+)
MVLYCIFHMCAPSSSPSSSSSVVGNHDGGCFVLLRFDSCRFNTNNTCLLCISQYMLYDDEKLKTENINAPVVACFENIFFFSLIDFLF